MADLNARLYMIKTQAVLASVRIQPVFFVVQEIRLRSSMPDRMLRLECGHDLVKLILHLRGEHKDSAVQTFECYKERDNNSADRNKNIRLWILVPPGIRQKQNEGKDDDQLKMFSESPRIDRHADLIEQPTYNRGILNIGCILGGIEICKGEESNRVNYAGYDKRY